jgi:hypothetical protein
LRVQRQQRGAEEKNDRQAQKEKNALEIPLPPVAKNHDHPKERQQGSRRQHDQPQIQIKVQMGFASGDSMLLLTARQSPSARLILHHLNYYK